MAVDVEQQQSTRDPARPSYIFRGHNAHIHSVQILRRNTCLLTGDADGWVVCWKLETKRPLAVWKAHDAAILGTAEWVPDNIITHGRDNALRIWQLKAGDHSFSTVLPADGTDPHRPKPWLLHSLPVNTLNFCAFTMCYQRGKVDAYADLPPTGSSGPIYIAVPGRDDKKAEVYQFPDEKLVCVVPKIEALDTGMVMALKLAHHQPSNNIVVIAGYEGGFTAVHLVPDSPRGIRTLTLELAQTIYLSQPHTQPVLSVDALPDGTGFFSSSADAIIAAHRILELPCYDDAQVDLIKDRPVDAINESEGPSASASKEGPVEPDNTTTLNDADVESATPTDDPRPTAPNSPGTTPSEDGKPSSPISFPKTRSPNTTPTAQASSQSARPSGLSTLLASAPSQLKPIKTVKPPAALSIQAPHKSLNTKHAGQQSLRVRSDGRLLVTGGWDSRIRVYSAKTLKEVAVLKWHKEGVYAVGFGEVLSKEDLESDRGDGKTGGEGEVVRRETGLAKLQRQREEVVKAKHWVVAGAKDGRVSLWEVF
ncbi:WD40 repeat-like protein [Bimuria novae-zelandiae CBS 107.79]|uniref:ASTRA-associated protein 1 n=1 Tax=Bimuria novae-zelandiae CBS 107.79 TaxID=1447943 RepID=A0A6A5UW08_9PLEO|nr:WD40 repeat-like protein [Bimuria novae-zelandiae CBS 107.79]